MQAETFNRYQDLARKLAHVFRAQYGGEYQDLEADAYFHMVSAYNSYDPSKGSLQKRISFTIWHGLLTDRQQHNRYRRRHRLGANFNRMLANNRQPLHSRLDETTTRAQGIASVVIDRQCPKMKGLVSYLLELGWAAEQVFMALGELKEAIQEI